MDLLRVGAGYVPTSVHPKSSCGGLDKGDDVVVPLDEGHSDHVGRVLGVVFGGL